MFLPKCTLMTEERAVEVRAHGSGRVAAGWRAAEKEGINTIILQIAGCP